MNFDNFYIISDYITTLNQCRPENNYSDSVCRQCCDTDNCTKAPTWWYPQSRAEWDYSGETYAEETYPANYRK